MTAVLLTPQRHPHPRSFATLTEPVSRGPGAVGAGVAVVVARVHVLRGDRDTAPVLDRHVRAGVPTPHRWRMVADVLVTRGGPGRPGALARRHPGALVTAAYHGQDCWLRLGIGGGARLRMRKRSTAFGAAAPPWDLPWPDWASLVHAWLVAGVPPEALAPSSARLIPARTGAGGAAPEQTVLLRAEP
ncbi:hypothetical protein [Streptomyces sp. NPDC005322]|uniref:hypothetical protein n=1 Tax=Streptomyces sp. NPDC005322 TaxID=3157032 RepID=UPI0033B646D0